MAAAENGGREPRLPVTIVTGFLGSGKTTFVNHILADRNGPRTAVMVNEIGDIAIDNDLIVGAGDDMVELANGCICCSINNDLVDAIFRVLRRRPPVDRVIVETTGLADPLPIVLTFLRSEFRDAMRLDAVVALADAESFSLDRFDAKAAQNQLRYADFVLLNKCDLVASKRAAAVEAKIRMVSKSAKILRTVQAAVPLHLVLGTGISRSSPQSGAEVHDQEHIEADGFEAVSFASEHAFAADRFQDFLEQLPGDVFRAKGVLAIEGSERRHLFHLSGRRFTLDKAPEQLGGLNRLVLIGRNLDAALLHAQLAACLAAPHSGAGMASEDKQSAPAKPTGTQSTVEPIRT
jgi:G3E family GTPase